jgi:hypothetical protein
MCDDFDFSWHELALIGSLAEEISEEEKERIRLDLGIEDACPSGCEDDDPFDPPDEGPSR